MLSIGLQQFIAKSIETCANIWTLKGCTASLLHAIIFSYVGPPSLSGAHSLRAEATRMCWIDWRQIEGHYYKSNNFRDGTTELGESIQICRNSRAGENFVSKAARRELCPCRGESAGESECANCHDLKPLSPEISA